MNRIITFFIIAIMALPSCNQKPKLGIKAEIGKLNDLLEKYEEPSQLYLISSDSIVKVIGKKGTVININPSDLITEAGQQIVDSIEVELKELTDQRQMFKTNTQTVSNGKLLVSGGAYFINIKSNGQQVRLKPDRTLKVEFPKLVENKMTLFYGQRDSLGQLNWDSVPKTFEKKPKLVSVRCTICGDKNCSFSRMASPEEAELADKLYAEIELSNLGWINCDRFLENENNTDLTVNFSPSEKINTANIYLIFEDINSVVQLYYIDDNVKRNNNVFRNIPEGANVRLVAYTLKENRIFTYSSNMIIKENETLTLAMKETNDSDFNNLINN
jgi:hypothetical protein